MDGIELERLGVGLERGRSVVAPLLVHVSQAQPERDLPGAARPLGELGVEQIDQLVLAPALGEHVGEVLDELRAPRLAEERAAQLGRRERSVAAAPLEGRALEQQIHRGGVVGQLGGPAQVLRELLLVAREPLHVGEVEVHHRIAREELEGAPEPVARALQIAQPLELDAARVVGDREPLQAILRQREAALLEILEQRPLLRLLGAHRHGLERVLLERIVGERAAVELGGAAGLAELALAQLGEPHLHGGALDPAQRAQRLLEGVGGLLGPPGGLLHVRQPEQRRHVAGLGAQRRLEGVLGLLRVAEPLEPDGADLARELGALDGAQREPGLHFRGLQHELPAPAARVQPAQLRKRGAQRWVEGDRLAVARGGSVEIVAALLQHLGEAQQEPSARLGRALGHEVARGQALLVDLEELAPLAGDEERLLEGAESDLILGARGEAGAQGL